MSYLPVELDKNVIQNIVNFTILITPLFSYGLTSYQIYLKKTTNGFSTDVCLIMLISSIFKIVYYLLEPYEVSLFRQALIMVFIQCVLLKVALKYMEPPAKLYEQEKVLNQSTTITEAVLTCLKYFDNFYKRPYNFWQWFDNEFKYWEFLVRFSLIITLVSLVGQNFRFYKHLIGILGLFTESILPLPQILLMHRVRSVKNFKWILLVSWLAGDFLKINYLIFGTDQVSSLFIFAALFQTFLDFFITGQYFYYKKLEMVLPR